MINRKKESIFIKYKTLVCMAYCQNADSNNSKKH